MFAPKVYPEYFRREGI